MNCFILIMNYQVNLVGAGINRWSNSKFSSFFLYYCQKLRNLFTTLGKFSYFLIGKGPVFSPKYGLEKDVTKAWLTYNMLHSYGSQSECTVFTFCMMLAAASWRRTFLSTGSSLCTFSNNSVRFSETIHFIDIEMNLRSR